MNKVNKKKLGRRPETPSTVITIVIDSKGAISHNVSRGEKTLEQTQVAFILADDQGSTTFGTSEPIDLNYVRGIAREGARLVRKMDELAQDMLANGIIGFLTEDEEEGEDEDGGEETPDSSDEDEDEEDEPEAPKPLAALDGCTVPGCPIAGGCGRKECPTKTA